MLALQAVTPARLVDEVPVCTLAEARKIVAMIHRGEPVGPTSAVRRVTAQAVRAAGTVPELSVVAETASRVDPFVKYLVESGGQRFETVRIPLEHPGRYTACVSSQVGCALACAFCATGRLGLSRNLAAWEIVEQVRVVRARLPAQSRVHGVVFQGMGEPLANLDAVLEAIAVLTDPCAQGIDARAITVCTAGLPSGIRRLALEAPRVRLGLSVSSAIEPHRKRVMPIAERHGFDDVIEAVAFHARTTNLSPMWAVTLLDGINDSEADARALAERVVAFRATTGITPRISIISYNSITAPDAPADPFRRSTREVAFRAVLSDAGLASHRRYSGGGDVGAACGQLAGALPA